MKNHISHWHLQKFRFLQKQKISHIELKKCHNNRVFPYNKIPRFKIHSFRKMKIHVNYKQNVIRFTLSLLKRYEKEKNKKPCMSWKNQINKTNLERWLMKSLWSKPLALSLIKQKLNVMHENQSLFNERLHSAFALFFCSSEWIIFISFMLDARRIYKLKKEEQRETKNNKTRSEIK